jgi:hypothetical protein
MATVSVHDVPTRAQAALGRSPLYELRNLDVQEGEQSLVISGTVSSFYHKQLAQEIVRSVCKGIEIVNSIRVS